MIKKTPVNKVGSVGHCTVKGYYPHEPQFKKKVGCKKTHTKKDEWIGGFLSLQSLTGSSLQKT